MKGFPCNQNFVPSKSICHTRQVNVMKNFKLLWLGRAIHTLLALLDHEYQELTQQFTCMYFVTFPDCFIT